jgi:hypothetical protein
VKGASSGTLSVRKGSLGSEAFVILKVTFYEIFFTGCCSCSCLIIQTISDYGRTYSSD